jgi:hypothetical protein
MLRTSLIHGPSSERDEDGAESQGYDTNDVSAFFAFTPWVRLVVFFLVVRSVIIAGQLAKLA